ncbi:sulfotransferase family protein [Actinophytocola sediminis]
MKVIGVGVARTGTVSLKAALERLEFGPCFHSSYVLDHPERLRSWHAAAAGEPVDMGMLFAGYGSSVAWPGATFWRELMSYYPDSKAILTERDPQRWYDSVRNTIYELTGGDGDNDLVEAARENVPSVRAMYEFNRKLIWEGFFDGRFADREHAMHAYAEHNAAVRREVPADRLLVYSVTEGWEPLCDFLGVPMPDEPFPRLNDSGAFWDQVRHRLHENTAAPGTT